MAVAAGSESPSCLGLAARIGIATGRRGFSADAASLDPSQRQLRDHRIGSSGGIRWPSDARGRDSPDPVARTFGEPEVLVRAER